MLNRLLPILLLYFFSPLEAGNVGEELSIKVCN